MIGLRGSRSAPTPVETPAEAASTSQTEPQGLCADIDIGTAALRIGEKDYTVLEASEGTYRVGARLIEELDEGSVARHRATMAEVAPALVDPRRIVVVQHALYPNGLANASPDEVRPLLGTLMVEIEERIQHFSRLQRRWEKRGTQTGLLRVRGSGGGHALLVVETVKRLAEYFPRAFIVVSYPVPQSPYLRAWSRGILEELLVSGAHVVIVQDDLRANRPDQQDLGHAHISAALLNGYTPFNQSDVAANNLYKRLCPYGVRGVLAVQDVYETVLPAERLYHDDELGIADDVYGIAVDTLQVEVLDALTRLAHNPVYNSIGLDLTDQRRPGTSRICVVSGNLGRQSLAQASDRLIRGQKAIGQFDAGTDLVLHRTRLPHPVDPDQAECQLVVATVSTVRDPRTVLDHLFADEPAMQPSTPQPSPTSAREVVPETVPLIVSSTGSRQSTPPMTESANGHAHSASRVFSFETRSAVRHG